MNDAALGEIATRLHSVSIQLLRTVRREDERSGLSAPRLSALSVIVFAGPLSLARLAAAEQVSPPTMSRIVDGLVQSGLVERRSDPADRRSVRIAATEAGMQVMDLARQRRVRALADRMAVLPDAQRQVLAQAAALLEELLS